jgi:hypothetical protein
MINLTDKQEKVITTWLNWENPKDSQPAIFAQYINQVIYYLTRLYVNTDELDDSILIDFNFKDTLSMLFQIENDFKELFPEKGGEA